MQWKAKMWYRNLTSSTCSRPWGAAAGPEELQPALRNCSQPWGAYSSEATTTGYWPDSPVLNGGTCRSKPLPYSREACAPLTIIGPHYSETLHRNYPHTQLGNSALSSNQTCYIWRTMYSTRLSSKIIILCWSLLGTCLVKQGFI